MRSRDRRKNTDFAVAFHCEGVHRPENEKNHQEFHNLVIGSPEIFLNDLSYFGSISDFKASIFSFFFGKLSWRPVSVHSVFETVHHSIFFVPLTRSGFSKIYFKSYQFCPVPISTFKGTERLTAFSMYSRTRTFIFSISSGTTSKISSS